MKEFTSQVCTTIEQSERLLKMGLKPETADMVYEYEGTYPYDCYLRILEDGDYISSNIITEDIPAWSLHRLIELMDVYEVTLEWKFGIYECVISMLEERIKDGLINKEYLK